MNKRNNNRFEWIDIAKGTAILSVILVHFPKEFSPVTYGITWHIPVFFAVTGILTSKKDNDQFRKIIEKTSVVYYGRI